MYSPSRFKITNDELIREIITRYNFATILVVTKDGEISSSHLPLVLASSGNSFDTLVGHMARANPQWRHFSTSAKVKVIFHGPHAYVSPRWYTPDPENVPTWNYAVVHVDGVAEIISDPKEVYDCMQKLVQQHDPSWPLDLPGRETNDMIPQIVAFRIRVESVNAKFKLSQNQPEPNRSNVIRELSQSQDQVERETAELMKRS